MKGLALFREHFRAYADRYVLIGGTACDLAMGAAGIDFRATKDLDIVLRVEALDAAFGRTFWDFVRAGGYRVRQEARGRTQFHRFQNPADGRYPSMLELFSRAPDALRPADDSRLTPIPMGGGISSLSAILLDEDYYRFLHAGRREADGLPYVRPEHLIPLKARAWLDLDTRRRQGEAIDARDVRKHRNDVFRLYRIVDPAFAGDVPERIRSDLAEFIQRMEGQELDLRALGLRAPGIEPVLAELRRVYRLGLP